MSTTVAQTSRFVWDQLSPGYWMLRGRFGHASVTRGPAGKWTWALVGWPGRRDTRDEAEDRDAAMMAAQAAIEG